MPSQHHDITHLDSAATAIPEMDPDAHLSRASAPCRTLSKMSFAEKTLIFKMFLHMTVVKKHGVKLERTFELIA